MFLFFVSEFQNISRLAIQFPADGFEGGEAHGFGFPRLQDGKVGGSQIDSFGQLAGRNLPLRHHYVEVYYNWHRLLFLNSQILFFFYSHADVENSSKEYDKCTEQREIEGNGIIGEHGGCFPIMVLYDDAEN